MGFKWAFRGLNWVLNLTANYVYLNDTEIKKYVEERFFFYRNKIT
jgi:hypothetical protein